MNELICCPKCGSKKIKCKKNLFDKFLEEIPLLPIIPPYLTKKKIVLACEDCGYKWDISPLSKTEED